MSREKFGVIQSRTEQAKRKEVEEGLDELVGVFDKEVFQFENASLLELLKHYSNLASEINGMRKALAEEYGADLELDDDDYYRFVGQESISRALYNAENSVKEGIGMDRYSGLETSVWDQISEITTKVNKGELFSPEEKENLIKCVNKLEEFKSSWNKSRLAGTIRKSLYDYNFDVLEKEKGADEKEGWFEIESERAADEAMALVAETIKRPVGNVVGYTRGVEGDSYFCPESDLAAINTRVAEAEIENKKALEWSFRMRTRSSNIVEYKPIFENELFITTRNDYYHFGGSFCIGGGKIVGGRLATKYGDDGSDERNFSLLGRPVTPVAFQRFKYAWDKAVQKQQEQQKAIVSPTA